jgi:hypothetical protein
MGDRGTYDEATAQETSSSSSTTTATKACFFQ